MMRTDLAQLLGPPGQLELGSDSERQPVWLRGSISTTDTRNRSDTHAYLQFPTVPRANGSELASLHPQTNLSSCPFFLGTLTCIRTHILLMAVVMGMGRG